MRTFRLTSRPADSAAVLSLLRDQGFVFSPLPFYADAFELEAGPFPLGSSLAARFGYIYIQDASSMLPALALLDIIKKDRGAENDPAAAPLRIMDFCSSPGGKSSLLGRELLARPGAFVLANEPGNKRLGTLQRNLQGMNLFNCGTSSFAGERLPLPNPGEDFAGWDYILLDPPCSGWGTAEKNPQVLSLWQGDKIKPLAGLQKMLLGEAFRLLKPGGALTYSTCTTNVQENEEQVIWALENLKDDQGQPPLLLSLDPYAGFDFAEPLAGCAGVLRVAQDSRLGQGFFIAALRKGGAAPLRPRCETLPGGADFGPDLNNPLISAVLLPPGRLAAQGSALVFQPQSALDFLPESFKWQGFPLGKSGAPAAKGQGHKRGRPGSLAGNPSGQSENMTGNPAAARIWARPRLDTALRGLMPPPEQARAAGAVVLDLEDTAPILALLSGQSLPLAPLATEAPGTPGTPGTGSDCRAQEAGLYYKGLPLCRLKLKGNRLMF